MLPRRRLLALVVAVALVAVSAGATLAAFSATTTNSGNNFSSKRIFPGARSESSWSVSDQADGSAANTSDPLSFAGDTRLDTTGNWSSAFASTRYVEFQYESSRAAGVPV